MIKFISTLESDIVRHQQSTLGKKPLAIRPQTLTDGWTEVKRVSLRLFFIRGRQTACLTAAQYSPAGLPRAAAPQLSPQPAPGRPGT